MVALRKCFWLGRVGCRADVGLALESGLCVVWGEVHRVLSVSTVSADSLRCHLAWKAAGRLVMTKHCRVALYHTLHLFMPKKLKTPHLLFSDLGAWFLKEIFCFLNCGACKSLFAHFAQIQHQAHVGLFQVYLTSSPCQSCRHVENLQDIS
jgi:hypothetical protein